MEGDDLKMRAGRGDPAAQLAMAAELDRQGRHGEAIDRLARAAKAGDPEALRLLGLRLIAGSNAPHLPQQGVGLLADAGTRGSIEACELSAVLAAGGIHRPQSWTEALAHLGRAVDLGSGTAREQLQLLGGDRVAGRSVAVDMAARLQAPPPRILSLSPRIVAIPGLVEPEICRWLIEAARPRLTRAKVYDSATGETTTSSARSNSLASFPLLETAFLNIAVQAKIGASIGVALPYMEAFSILHYAVGEEAREHADYIEPAAPGAAAEIARFGQRVATALVYLNDEYEGGATEFPTLRISHRGRTGDALIFFGTDAAGMPDPRTIHAGRPPGAGEKWVLSQFIRNKRAMGI